MRGDRSVKEGGERERDDETARRERGMVRERERDGETVKGTDWERQLSG